LDKKCNKSSFFNRIAQHKGNQSVFSVCGISIPAKCLLTQEELSLYNSSSRRTDTALNFEETIRDQIRRGTGGRGLAISNMQYGITKHQNDEFRNLSISFEAIFPGTTFQISSVASKISGTYEFYFDVVRKP
jgi:hypothetical protein